MKKVIITAALLAISGSAIYAQKFMTRTGKIIFNATAPHSPEKVEAINNEVACVMDGKTGDVIFQVPVKSFKFERQLMEEHFNENYIESDKYPKANFSGKIENVGDVNFAKDGTYNAKVGGKLTIHGATNDISVPGTVTVKGGSVMLKTKFTVKLIDYKITVPSLVADKLSKEAVVTVESELAHR
jgi:hypothetical protein